MKINPIYKRETTVSARSFRLALILLVFNSILAVVALLNMYSVIAQVKMTAEIQYSRFMELYIFVASIEFLLLMFIMPAITAGSISGERERQTLDLMLTTMMTPADIVLGKLAAAFSTMFMLIFSSFPVLALIFVYGGVTVGDITLLMVCFVTVALFTGSLGICFSSIFKKSTIATVVSYGTLALFVAGTYAVNVFAMSISRMNINSYMNTMDSVTKQANSGGCLYLLLLNPAVTFYRTISRQAGESQLLTDIGKWFDIQGGNMVLDHWVAFSIALQLLLSLIMLAVAVRSVSGMRKESGRKMRKRSDNRK